MIYPPTLKSTQSAFLESESVYNIHFTLQSITAFSDIGHVQIRVVRQANNRTIVNTNIYPDGIIYKPVSAIQTDINGGYYIPIETKDLAESWRAGYLYKVQMRFGSTGLYSSLENFATWKTTQIDLGTFSEWSTVMIIKAISKPTIYIQNNYSNQQDVISTSRTESTLTPLFSAITTIKAVNNELVDKYKFDLYLASDLDNVLETSGWLQQDSSVNNISQHRFKSILTNEEEYTVIYSIRTVNGYEDQSAPYTFMASMVYLDAIQGLAIDGEANSEDGCVEIYGTALNQKMSGSFVISRSSEKTNYGVWEDLTYLTYSNKQLDNDLIYRDFTIESGVRYRYAIQQENKAGLRTAPIYIEHYIMVDFEYSYIYRDGIQLRLSFNQTVNSFKHTVLRTKQDTLGDRYPHLVQNGSAYYAEFPISGLISIQADENSFFLTKKGDGYYYKDELVIPQHKFDTDDLTINTDLLSNNIFVERIFREKVEEFLNGFNYKLYKSPTEGNMVIELMNVSLAPNTTVNRMLYTFSATAYEVEEATLENLDRHGIITIGEYESLETGEVFLSFGQVKGIYGNAQDIYSLIRQQEEISIGGGYKYSLQSIKSLWIEQYPVIDLTADILELQAQKAQLEDTTEIDKQIVELQALEVILRGPTKVNSEFYINGSTTVILPPNKVYSLRDENITALSLIQSTTPIIVNYVCELTQIEDKSVAVISGIDASRIWGQISGVFTGTHSVLETYRYDYADSETYRIYNRSSDALVEYDELGQVLVDNTTFNVYKSTNILDIIKEETRHQVELLYNTKFSYIDNEWTNGSIIYNFSTLRYFDIEADPGTKVYIGKSADGSDAAEILIGESGRYVLGPMEELVQYIALESPQFCVINYKCLTSQKILSKVG